MAGGVMNQESGKDWTLFHGDCVEVARGLPSDSLHYTIYSPPFQSLYTFSDDPRDMSNCADDETFWAHYRYLAHELARATMPGRLVSVHCMQLPTSKVRNGFIGLSDFRGDIIRAHCGELDIAYGMAIGDILGKIDALEEEGGVTGLDALRDIVHRLRSKREEAADRAGHLIYHSEVCIRKDPVSAMQRTKSIGLLHKQVVKDSALSRMAVADYVVTMRKPGDNPEPIAGGFDAYHGTDNVPATDPGRASHHVADSYSVKVWQRYAEPVWMDIAQSDVLSHRAARAEEDERHISPLQLTVIRRCIQLWSNPGDVVFSPFAGIGSELYVAIEMGRRALGAELKKSYFDQAVANLQEAERQRSGQTLFDLVEGAA